MANRERIFGLQWHITNRCDQRCRHCYIWGKDRAWPSEQEYSLQECIRIIDNFLNFCEEFNVKPSLAITGGDPLLFDEIWAFLEYLRERKQKFILLGNPFHLTNDICFRLHHLGCKSYQMSLDGLEQTHDSIRRKGSFKETVRAIPLLKEAGIKTVIMSTVSRLNYREIPRLVQKLVIRHFIDVHDFGRFCPTPRDAKLTMSPGEYRDFLSIMWDTYVELARNHRTRFPLKDHLWRLFLYEKGLFFIEKSDIVLQGCNCGIRHITLLPEGKVYACRRFESLVGDIFQQSFKDIFLGEALRLYRQVQKMEGCKDCELLNYCRGCHAVSYGTFGDFFAKDPQCWKVNGSY